MQEGAQEGLPDWLRSFTASQEGGHPKRLPRRGPSPGTSTTRRPQVLEAAGVSPELRALLTTDHMEARLHAVPLAWVRQDKMAAQLRHYRGRFDTSEREPPRWARLGGRRLARLGLRVGCPRSPHTRLHCLHLAVLLRRRLPLQPRRWRPPVPLPRRASRRLCAQRLAAPEGLGHRQGPGKAAAEGHNHHLPGRSRV